MFEYQEKLKQLPFPKLENTLGEYKKWIRPLLTEEEYKNTEKLLASFAKENGAAETLHQCLIDKFEQEKNKSWLIELWYDMYLEYREPLPINMNYYTIFNNKEFAGDFTAVQILSLVIAKIAQIYTQIVEKTFAVEKIKDIYFCMKQYENVFAATRIPSHKKDIYTVIKENKAPYHIIFSYKNNLYKIVVTDENGEIVSPFAIENTIHAIIKSFWQLEVGIGALTTAKREKAATLYSTICENKKNKENYEILCNAIAVFCLDDKDVKEDLTANFLSCGENRFFDKSTQFIVTQDKEIGINAEHTGADATVYLNIIGQVYDYIVANKTIFKKESKKSADFEKLQWEFSESIQNELKFLLDEHKKNAVNIFTQDFCFEEFGKNYIKTFKISPDAFFHVALQLAQYRAFGILRSTYEPIAMRDYLDGRTECARPVTQEVKDLVDRFDVQKDNEKKKELLKKALVAHIDRIKLCKSGNGIERHLYALEKMNKLYIQNEEAELFFDDISYKKLRTDFISTSNCGSEKIRCFGFGRVVPGGYGIGYNVNNKNISVTISSDKENEKDARKLIQNLFVALKEIADVFK